MESGTRLAVRGSGVASSAGQLADKACAVAAGIGASVRVSLEPRRNLRVSPGLPGLSLDCSDPIA
jgi:hypothetical protein